jgi:2-aminoadipate transaminase
MDGRCGSSMRLNFSGVGDAEIREGVRRIGEVIGEQVELFGSLTGHMATPRPAAPAAPPVVDPGLADVLHLPRTQGGGTSARRSDGTT